MHIKRNWSESSLLFSPVCLCGQFTTENLSFHTSKYLSHPVSLECVRSLYTVGCLIISTMDNHHRALWIEMCHQKAESILTTSSGKPHIPVVPNVWITFGCSPPQWSCLVCRYCATFISPADTHIPVMEGKTLAAGAGGIWRYMTYMPIGWPAAATCAPVLQPPDCFISSHQCVCVCLHKNIYSQTTCVFIDMSVCIH